MGKDCNVRARLHGTYLIIYYNKEPVGGGLLIILKQNPPSKVLWRVIIRKSKRDIWTVDGRRMGALSSFFTCHK